MAAATLFGVLSTAPAATAAVCSGVTVVVDFHQLGGVQQTCDAAGGGKAASDIFVESGFALQYSQQQPGAVCRVDGQPSNQACVTMPPANAYWALYWSDGSDGTWTYASVGVRSLKVPAGASVAFSWSQGGDARPSVTAPVTVTPSTPAAVTPTATKSATAVPTRRASSSPRPRTTRIATGSPSPTSSAPSHASASTDTAPSESAVPTTAGPPPAPPTTTTAIPTDATSASNALPASGTSTPAPSHDGGLPAWVPVALVGVLILGAGVIVAVRRRP